MEKLRSLNLYQKIVLLFMTILVLLFAALYAAAISRVGYRYCDEILVPSQEQGSTVYTGQIRGTQARFTVSEDKTVTLQYGSRTYGPYTAREDPAAIPDHELAEHMVGIELRQGNSLLFRGGMLESADSRWLYAQDRTLENYSIIVTTGDGVQRDETGAVIDPVEPTAFDLLDLMTGPELTHKGHWLVWLVGALICAATAVSILFAEELFRWKISLRVRDPERVVPSELELIGRYFSWTVMSILAAVLFFLGLQ